MLRRTPFIAIVLSGILTAVTMTLIESPLKPFTVGDTLIFYFIGLLPSMGIALLFDPSSIKAKEEYLKINFYEEKQS